MSEDRKRELREAILEREPGGCAMFVGWWILIGGLTALDQWLPSTSWVQDWPGILSRYAVAAVVWSGLMRSYARRSLRSLGLAAPFAIIGVLLSERFYGWGTSANWIAPGIFVPVMDVIDLALRLRSRRRKRGPVSA